MSALGPTSVSRLMLAFPPFIAPQILLALSITGQVRILIILNQSAPAKSVLQVHSVLQGAPATSAALAHFVTLVNAFAKEISCLLHLVDQKREEKKK
jgi:hypothetical protein